jgi:type IV secretory pathway TrbF-like protein
LEQNGNYVNPEFPSIGNYFVWTEIERCMLVLEKIWQNDLDSKKMIAKPLFIYIGEYDLKKIRKQ